MINKNPVRHNLKVISCNIRGVSDKLSDTDLQEFLFKNDIPFTTIFSHNHLAFTTISCHNPFYLQLFFFHNHFSFTTILHLQPYLDMYFSYPLFSEPETYRNVYLRQDNII